MQISAQMQIICAQWKLCSPSRSFPPLLNNNLHKNYHKESCTIQKYLSEIELKMQLQVLGVWPPESEHWSLFQFALLHWCGFQHRPENSFERAGWFLKGEDNKSQFLCWFSDGNGQVGLCRSRYYEHWKVAIFCLPKLCQVPASEEDEGRHCRFAGAENLSI